MRFAVHRLKIARVRFPGQGAATTLEWQGKKFYFVGVETRREFEKQQGIGAKGAAFPPEDPLAHEE
jgi:hypothetical protein